uniref:Uncharacterized protein n=1 Tax=Acrobeloides nanus TaxID=290746 RepID=A0A914DT73_9BILA
MLTIVFPKKTAFFTRSIVIKLSIGVFIVAYMMGTLTHFVLPCCRIYLWYVAYTTVYLDHDFNYVDWFVDLPLNLTSSTIAIICYGTVRTSRHRLE